MYGPANGNSLKWGHGALGITDPSDTWYFAEGAVHSSFETFLLLGNITDAPVDVTIRFLLPEGDPVIKHETIGALTRESYPGLEAEVPSAEVRAVITARSDVPDAFGPTGCPNGGAPQRSMTRLQGTFHSSHGIVWPSQSKWIGLSRQLFACRRVQMYWM